MSINATPTVALDRLSSLLERFQVSAHLFHTGALCGITSFDAQPGRGFFHVLRRGSMVVTHHQGAQASERLEISEPTLLFYPQPLAHQFHNAPKEGSDFTCASVHFEGGGNHPLARALPPVIVLPLAKVPGLEGALDLLFQEADSVRCGHRLIVDRLSICSCWRSDNPALFSLNFCDHVRAILVETFQHAAQKRARGRRRLHSPSQVL